MRSVKMSPGKGIVLSVLVLMVFSRCNKSDGPGPATSTRLTGTLSIENRQRTFLVNLPPAYRDSASIPLVIFLHGFAGKASQAEEDYGFTQKADANHFAVVYAEGVQSTGTLGLRSWNVGSCCDFAQENNINDVKFIDSLIIVLTTEFPKLNKKRIYVTGISNGGMMAYRLAADLGHKIAAIAPVAATMMYPSAAATRKIPILHIHSELDTKVPFNGGVGIGGYNFESVNSTLTKWSAFNGCNGETSVVADSAKYKQIEYNGCSTNAVISLYLTKDGGHSWPGGKRASNSADEPSSAFNATDLIWNFFKKYQLP